MNPSVVRETDANRLVGLVNAFYGSASVCAAAELGIFAELAHLRKMDADSLAHALKLDPACARVFLDGCVALGLLEKDGLLYRNSIEAETYLVPGSPLDLSWLIREAREVYGSWAHLADFVRTGTAVAPPNGLAESDPTRLKSHLLSLHKHILYTGRPIVRRLDLHGRRKLLDLGGGPGTYSVLISLEYPQLLCTVLDRPEVLKIAAALIEQQGASQTVSTVAGDFLREPLPGGNDAVCLFGLLHRLDAPQIPRLIERVADSLNPGGVVYVMDPMTDETRTMPRSSALFALNMALTRREGDVFSDVELQNWIEEAGLRDFAVEVLPQPQAQWLARARKPG